MKFDVKLVELPEKVLRKKSLDCLLPLSKEDDLLAQKMIYHVTESIKKNSPFRPAVGVAAVQYGILKKMFFVHIKNNKGEIEFSDVLINPKVIAKSESLVALQTGEGCLSVNEKDPNQEGFIRRSERIKLKAYSYYQKKEIIIDARYYLAIVLQHELDHLDGKLFIDHIQKNKKWIADKDLILL
ncbi:MAG: peptide deformylase [Metamycoplasmataceae bacterium]